MASLSSCPINRLQQEPLSAAGLHLKRLTLFNRSNFPSESSASTSLWAPLETCLFAFHMLITLRDCSSGRWRYREVKLRGNLSPPPQLVWWSEFIQEGAGTQGGDTERD